MAGTLFVVATPIGNLEDITARALRVLREVAVIAAEDTRRTAHLLARYGITTRTTSLHEHNEQNKSVALVGRLVRGESVALVSDAGTPTVSDPGHRLVRQATDRGIRVEPIPGPSAVMAALSVCGLPADRFTFLGFPPVRSQARLEWLQRLAACSETVVFYESPHRIRETLEDVRGAVGDCPAFVARELTKSHEELVNGPISELVSRLEIMKGEFTIVLNIGHKTELAALVAPEPTKVAAEFGLLMESGQWTRRQAIAQLSRKYRLRANELYGQLQKHKSSVG
jgi:16S rRNA (cytidine1402-2'-O)-methyltransferase